MHITFRNAISVFFAYFLAINSALAATPVDIIAFHTEAQALSVFFGGLDLAKISQLKHDVFIGDELLNAGFIELRQHQGLPGQARWPTNPGVPCSFPSAQATCEHFTSAELDRVCKPECFVEFDETGLLTRPPFPPYPLGRVLRKAIIGGPGSLITENKEEEDADDLFRGMKTIFGKRTDLTLVGALRRASDVTGGEEYWNHITQLRLAKAHFACSSSRMYQADASVPGCSQIFQIGFEESLPESQSTSILFALCAISTKGTPRLCTPIAAKIDGIDYVLAIVGIHDSGGRGASFNVDLGVTGFPGTEDDFRKLLQNTLSSMQLEVSGGPRAPLVVGETLRPVLDPSIKAYVKRSISISYGKAPTGQWVISLGIWVFTSKRNVMNELMQRADLEPQTQVEFISDLRRQAQLTCSTVEMSVPKGGLQTLTCK